MARPASDIRPRLLAAALARFLNEGVDGASLRRIADDADTNIGMVYYYFKTKDELFLAVIEEVYAGLLVEVETLLAEPSSSHDLLRTLYARVARLGSHEMDVLRLVLREALVSSERLSRVTARFERGHVPLVIGMLMRGAAAGELDATLHPAVMLAAAASLGMMPQLVHRLISAARPDLAALLPSREQVAQTMSEVLLRGIAAPSAQSLSAAPPKKPRKKKLS